MEDVAGNASEEIKNIYRFLSTNLKWQYKLENPCRRDHHFKMNFRDRDVTTLWVEL